jgi:hypothetical protein
LKSRFFVLGFGAVGMVISGWFFTQAAWVLAKEGEGKCPKRGGKPSPLPLKLVVWACWKELVEPCIITMKMGQGIPFLTNYTLAKWGGFRV